MVSTLPPLVADGGELRLARRVASLVYGRREVTWPGDVADPEDDLPDGREFGWVAKLDGPEPGLSERRFVRADVSIDAVEKVSDVEQVLDDAALRAGGDVYFESLIEGKGLGLLKPGVDFDEGDLVDVRFWGRILKDQLVTSIDWDDDDPSVKLGGQSIRDTDSLARARAESLRLIRRERAERKDDVRAVDSKASQAKDTADSALDAVNDADGLIQGSVRKAADYSRESHEHSEASQRHSTDAKAYSDLSHIYSRQSQQISAQSVAHSAISIEYSEESHEHSQKSQEYSEASFTHSDAARVYSEAANSASQQAKQYSEQVQDLQPVIEQAASDAQDASEESSQYSAESKSASEQSSVHSQAATDAANLSQDALRLAELARDAAETSRRDAEAKRDEAEQARAAGFRAMMAASAAMAQAEQSRAEAEEQRRLAENERAAAEDQRSLAETARAAAEGARDTAEQKRAAAEGERSRAETARSGAETARDTAEQKRAAAESERALAESARDTAELARANAFESREAAMRAFVDMQTLIDAEQNELIDQIAQQQRDLAESNKGRVNQIQATKAGTTWPGIAIQEGRNPGTTWGITLPDSRGALVHTEHFRRVSGSSYGITKFKENLLTPVSGGWFIDCEEEEYVRVTWGGVEANQVSIDKSQSAIIPAQTTWTQLASLTQQANFKATNGYLSLRVTWSAANRGSTYIIRILADGQEIARKSSSSLGPLSFMGTGVRSQNLTVANVTLAAGKSVTVEAYCTAGSSSQRRIGSAALKGTWIETQ